MDAMMQQILSKKSQKTTVVFKTISKPKFIGINNPCVTSDSNHLFYTFDGRAVYYSKDQKEPIISLPDELKDCQFVEANGSHFCITLSSKGKLECVEYANVDTGLNRYVLNRNVVSMSKSNNKIFYLFKKDQFSYISECAFDGKKWLGRILIPNIPTNNVLLVASESSFYYVADSVIYNSKGRSLEIHAEYAYQHSNLLFVVDQVKSSLVTLKLLDINSSFKEINRISFKNDQSLFKIVAKENIVVLQFGTQISIFKIDQEQKAFSFMWKFNYKKPIYDLDFVLSNSCITFHILSDEKVSDITHIVTDSNLIPSPESDSNDDFVASDYSILSNANCNSSLIKDQESLEDSLESSSLEEKSIKDTPMLEFFYDPHGSSSPSVYKGNDILAMSQKINLPTPKNNLLEEVRATLNKKKPSVLAESASEPKDAKLDRFGSFLAQNNADLANSEIKSNLAVQFSKSKDDMMHEKLTVDNSSPFFTSSQPDIDKMPNFRKNSPLFEAESTPNLGMFASTNPKAPFEFKPNKKYAPDSPSAVQSASVGKSQLDAVIQSIKELKITIGENQNKINSLSKNMLLFKKEDIEGFIKDIIIKTIVPSVEACFNEMRVQMQVEMKKLIYETLSKHSTTEIPIARLLSEGHTGQAIGEFLKLDESQMSAVIPLFLSATLENADSLSIYQLISKTYDLARKAPKDVYFKLIYLCLLDIEISDISIDKLQDLSLILRYIKEIEGFDEEKFSELGCVIDIVSKKIRKRAKMANGK